MHLEELKKRRSAKKPRKPNFSAVEKNIMIDVTCHLSGNKVDKLSELKLLKVEPELWKDIFQKFNLKARQAVSNKYVPRTIDELKNFWKNLLRTISKSEFEDEECVPCESSNSEKISKTGTKRQKTEEWMHKQSNHCNDLLESLYVCRETSDVKITTQGRTVRAHKFILRAASGYFEEVLSTTPVESVVVLQDIDYEVMENIVKYMYRGELTVNPMKEKALTETIKFLRIHTLEDVTIQSNSGNTPRKSSSLSSSSFQTPKQGSDTSSPKDINTPVYGSYRAPSSCYSSLQFSDSSMSSDEEICSSTPIDTVSTFSAQTLQKPSRNSSKSPSSSVSSPRKSKKRKLSQTDGKSDEPPSESVKASRPSSPKGGKRSFCYLEDTDTSCDEELSPLPKSTSIPESKSPQPTKASSPTHIDSDDEDDDDDDSLPDLAALVKRKSAGK